MKKYFFWLFVMSFTYNFTGNDIDLYRENREQQLGIQYKQKKTEQRVLSNQNRKNNGYKESLAKNAHLKNKQLKNHYRN